MIFLKNVSDNFDFRGLKVDINCPTKISMVKSEKRITCFVLNAI